MGDIEFGIAMIISYFIVAVMLHIACNDKYWKKG